MHDRRILIIGGSGFLGQEIAKKLIRAGAIVTIASRFPEAAAQIKTEGNVGQVNLVSINVFNESNLDKAVKGHDTVINLLGVLFEKNKQNFQNIHTFAAANIAKSCFKNNIRTLIHISALGVNKNMSSKYAISKFEGEKQVKKFFPNVIIIRPGLVFGHRDDFFNKFAIMAKYFRFLSVVNSGQTLFQPVYVQDIALAIKEIINNKNKFQGNIFELAGPKIYSFKDLMQYTAKLVKKKVFILSIPGFIASIMAILMEFMPKPLLTRDQIKLLKNDNIQTNDDVLTFRNLDIHPQEIEKIVPDYIK